MTLLRDLQIDAETAPVRASQLSGVAMREPSAQPDTANAAEWRTDPAEAPASPTVAMRRSKRNREAYGHETMTQRLAGLRSFRLLALTLLLVALFIIASGTLIPPWQQALFLAGLSVFFYAAHKVRHGRSQTAEDPPDDLVSMRQRNHHLAQRLEALEDRSWEIRESEETHRSLAETFGDIVVQRDDSGVVVFKNSIFDRYFDGSCPLPQFHSEPHKRSGPDPAGTLHEIQLETRRGKRWFSWADLPVRDTHTGKMGIRSVGRDVTRQKQAQSKLQRAFQDAKSANETKSRFLAMVSHEIRTPLNGVIGMAGLLRDTPLDPDQKNYVEAIDQSGKTLLSLIEDLLDTTRIEQGQLILSPQPTDIRHLVEATAEQLAPVANAKHLHLATFVDPRLSGHLQLDGARLRQILLNLAGNAVKFTRHGGVSIEVHSNDIDVTSTDEVGLRVLVADSGPGLAPTDQERVFEEFVQTDAGATRQYGGAGLGLAISRNLVNLMGGTIGVTSKLGKGSVFSFEILVARHGVEEAEQAILPESSRRIAVALQRTPARKALVATLRAMGSTISTFDNLQAFQVNQEAQQSYDAVLAEADQWNNSSINAIRAGQSSRCQLIALAAQSMTRSRESGGDYGVDAWLTWPVRSRSLRAALNGTFAQKRDHEDHGNGERKTAPDHKGLHILLAEDNAINALLTRSLLHKSGHSSVHVENGAKALDALANEQFDLVLLDMHMPVMDGMTTLQELRQADECTRNADTLPVIMLSADGQNQVRREALELGVCAFLTKPLDPEQLFEHLNNVAAQSRRV